jgi:hypothetical protein
LGAEFAGEHGLREYRKLLQFTGYSRCVVGGAFPARLARLARFLSGTHSGILGGGDNHARDGCSKLLS